MGEIRRIGFATDFSKVSKYAEDMVQMLRNTFHAELFVIHVFYGNDLRIPEPYYFMPGLDKWMLEREEKVLAFGKDSVEKLADRMGNAKGIFLEGKPGPCIVDFAEKSELDLLIMGTHGYRGFNRLMLGSIAEYVLRHAHCPVLTVKPPKDSQEEEEKA